MTFDPDDDFAGLASFAYTVDDQQGHSVAGAVTVEVLPPSNRPPVAQDTILTVEAGTPLTIDLAALVTDPDPNDTLTFTSTGPSTGAVSLAADGSTVIATAPLEGTDTTDSFQYTVTDAAGEAATATVSLTVTAPAAPPPQAQGDQATTNQGQAVTVAVLGNDLDPLGRGLTVTSVGATPAGSATTDGSNVTFTPNPDFFGPASFIYRIRDGANTARREAEAQVAVTVIGQPSAPGTPIAREGNATATVTWAAPPSNGAPIDDYELRIEGGSSVSVGTATGYTWNGLTNGVPVSFSVRAHNSAGWGPWSGPSPAVTPDIEPGRPAAPTVQFADRALIVTWSPPANEGSAITNYDIQIGGNASAVQRIGATTQFRWEGLTNGQEYTFQVRAVNAKGEGEFSSPSAPEHPLRPPDAPAAPVGERGDKTITVNWGAPGNGGDPIIEYQVQIALLRARRTPRRARRSAGPTCPTANPSSSWSAPATAPTGARGRRPRPPSSRAACPTHPTNVAATRGDQSAGVTWTAPNNQGCAITGYTVRANGGGGTNVGGGQTSATVGGLSNGTSYTFTVIARNEVGDSAVSPASNAVIPAGPPCAPSITGADAGHRAGHRHVEPRRATTARRSPPTSCPSTAAAGRTSATARRTPAPGSPTARSTRSRSAPSTTSGPGAGGNTVNARTPGRAGAGRRPRRRRRRTGGIGATLVGAERQRQADHPLRGRHPARRRRATRTRPSHAWDGPAATAPTYTRAGPGVQRGRLRRVERRAERHARRPRRRDHASASGRTARRRRCDTPSCAHLSTSTPPAWSRTPATRSTASRGSAASSTPAPRTSTNGPSGTVNIDIVCYFGYPGATVWVTLNGIRSDNTTSWLIEPHRSHTHETDDRPTSRVVQPLVQRPARQRRARSSRASATRSRWP